MKRPRGNIKQEECINTDIFYDVQMLRLIIDDLFNTKLLKISLVNKLLNVEAPSFMRDLRTFKVRLHMALRDVVPFVSALEK